MLKGTQELEYIKFIFPSAPAQKVTASKKTTPAWGRFILAGYVPLLAKIQEVRYGFSPRPTPYTRRLGAPDTEPSLLEPTSDEVAEAFDSDCDSDSEAIGSIEGTPLPPPIYASLAKARGVKVLQQPGIRFVTYENLSHWTDDAEFQDLGTWPHALLPAQRREREA
ncbi:hypothetical protein DXG01_014174 [Tephrocybe rancida]|nr:hypothetical protein DXG01_014174 [Tephrocybe rancida]